MLLVDQSTSFAETGDVHTHQHHDNHSGHAHTISVAEVIVDLETQPAEIKAGMPATIQFFIKDNKGKPIQDLTITHERLLHIVIVSKDFSTFAHIHPEDFGPITPDMKKAAEFRVRYAFPKAGEYLIAVDSAAKDVPFSEHFSIDVIGEPQMGPQKKDFSREKRFGDYNARLSFSPERISAGKEILLKYTVKKGEEPVKDLEPYLSAPMHIAIISFDLNNFIHAHGELPGAPHAGHYDHTHMNVPEKFGPSIEASVVFPAKGVYQIFSEIKHKGKVIPLSFMVEVE